MAYSIKSIDYLSRARSRLDALGTENLFYAAFELRCGIEARLKEYLDAQAETTKKKRNGWRIDKLVKQIESIFKLNSKGLKLIVFDPETTNIITTILYTPVTPQLQKMGERLGDYMHSQNTERLDSDVHWTLMRRNLEMTYQELGFATSGTLMAPPLVHPLQEGAHFFCISGDQRNIFPPGKRIGMPYEIYELEPLQETDF